MTTQVDSNEEFIILKCSYFLFKIYGLAPVSFRNTFIYNDKNNYMDFELKCQSSFSDLIYSIVCLTLYLILGTYCSPITTDEDYPDKSNTTYLLECILAVLQIASVVAMYISICLKRKNIADTINKLIELDSSMVRMSCYYKINSSLTIILILCTNAIIGIGAVATHMIELSQNMAYLVQLIGGIIVNWFIIEYVIILELIISRISSLNKLILKIGGRTLECQEDIFFKTRIKLENINLIGLTSIRQAVSAIHTISSFTVNLFSFPLLWIILYNGGAIIYLAYYIIIFFIDLSSNQTLTAQINSILSLMIPSFPIIMLAQKVGNFKEEMNHTGNLVHKIISRSKTNNEIKKELKQLAKELLASNVGFTSSGIFELDATLFASMFGTMATYLVILCQLR